MVNTRGESDGSPIAIFAIIAVILIALFVFAAYSYGFFPFAERTNTVVVQDNNPDTVVVRDDTPDTVVVRDEPDNVQNNYNNTIIVNNPPSNGS